MANLQLNKLEVSHAKRVLQEDMAKRLKSIRDAHDSRYYDDENLRERIKLFNRSEELLRKIEQAQRMDDAVDQAVAEGLYEQLAGDNPDDDMYRID